MNNHKNENARTTFEGRKLLIERIAAMGLMPAASAARISATTARKWLKRFTAVPAALEAITARQAVGKWVVLPLGDRQ